MNNKKYFLAMYDVRGKQDFIFNTDRIKEIIGASKIIEDVFADYLYETKCGNIFHDSSSAFTKENYEAHLKEGYIGEVVYEGGGNFFVLFNNKETFRDVTFEFTKKVKEKIGTLRVLAAGAEIDSFDDFKEDQKRLYKEHAKLEASETNIGLWQSLPIVQVDRRTSYPLTSKWNEKWGEKRDVSGNVSKESAAKYKKYSSKTNKALLGEKVLDKIVSERGTESLLAVVYIDGNNMGQQVAERLKDEKTYEECVRSLREFSKEIQKNYVDDPIKKVIELIENKRGDKKHRFIIGAGDETNFICNARDAYDLARQYLQSLPDGCSACAGIAVFHSHAPYAQAYRIAEECCENGKRKMREENITKASFIDFHYIQGGIENELELIREKEVGKTISKPWLVSCANDEKEKISKDIVTIEEVEEIKKLLNTIGHSNVKGLLGASLAGQKELEFEMTRIKAHMSSNDRKPFDTWEKLYEENKDKYRYLVYDMVSTYDIWFMPEED